jgi:DNA-binding CsgD family transcriptional regulator
VLTQGETRVLRYLPTHMGAPEIATELFLSANTVKTHLRHLYQKLGAHTRQEAVPRAGPSACSQRPLPALDRASTMITGTFDPYLAISARDHENARSGAFP